MKRKRNNPDDETFPEAAEQTFREFHGRDSDKITTLKLEDGSNKELKLVGLGVCPSVSWLSSDGKDIKIVLNGEDDPTDNVSFKGYRVKFKGKKPLLCALCHESGKKELLIVGPAVAQLRKYANASGKIGQAPCCDYSVPWNSAKLRYSFTHEFERPLPTLVLDSNDMLARYSGGSYVISRPTIGHGDLKPQSWLEG